MNDKPKNGFAIKIIMFLFGLILVTGFPMIINGVIANDRLREDGDKKVAEDCLEGNESVRTEMKGDIKDSEARIEKKIDKVYDEIAEVRTDQKVFRVEQQSQSTTLANISATLEFLKNK